MGFMTPLVRASTIVAAGMVARVARFGARSMAGSWQPLQRVLNTPSPAAAGAWACAANGRASPKARAAAASVDLKFIPPGTFFCFAPNSRAVFAPRFQGRGQGPRRRRRPAGRALALKRAAFARPLGALGEGVADIRVRDGQLVSQARERGDQDRGAQGGDQPVLDGGGAGLVLRKARQKPEHGSAFPNAIWPARDDKASASDRVVFKARMPQRV